MAMTWPLAALSRKRNLPRSSLNSSTLPATDLSSRRTTPGRIHVDGPSLSRTDGSGFGDGTSAVRHEYAAARVGAQQGSGCDLIGARTPVRVRQEGAKLGEVGS